VTARSDGDLPITFLLLALADDTLADPIEECMTELSMSDGNPQQSLSDTS
jgi:hypothetical protein